MPSGETRMKAVGRKEWAAAGMEFGLRVRVEKKREVASEKKTAAGESGGLEESATIKACGEYRGS